jgi:hypothetical protein
MARSSYKDSPAKAELPNLFLEARKAGRIGATDLQFVLRNAARTPLTYRLILAFGIHAAAESSDSAFHVRP